MANEVNKPQGQVTILCVCMDGANSDDARCHVFIVIIIVAQS